MINTAPSVQGLSLHTFQIKFSSLHILNLVRHFVAIIDLINGDRGHKATLGWRQGPCRGDGGGGGGGQSERDIERAPRLSG